MQMKQSDMRRKHMNNVQICDATLKQNSARNLSFREKTELVRLLDKMKTDVIEIGPIEAVRADSLFIKTAADAVKDSTLAVLTDWDQEIIAMTWEALKNAAHPRLQIKVPVSLVQMEYLYHKKPEAVKAAVTQGIAYAKTLCPQAEFIASDATRAERPFLYEVLEAAIQAGADVVTVCDTDGAMLPEEFGAFVKDVRENVPSIDKAVLGFACSDLITMADACSIAAMIAGGQEVKASVYPENMASIRNLASVISKKGSQFGFGMNIRTVELKRLTDQVARMFTETKSKTSPFDTGVREDVSGRTFSVNDDMAAVIKETKKLGYDLSEEDQVRVYEEFRNLAARKEQVSSREIDAIVASWALQVPPSYILDNYIINSSNVFAASAHIRVKKDGEIMESVALGDGPVDAAFLALEQIVGRHYELDDFQIRSVTEGREAMGETVVKLRVGGKIYSGRGLSTDIIGSSISAYISALNKIVYEEEHS